MRRREFIKVALQRFAWPFAEGTDAAPPSALQSNKTASRLRCQRVDRYSSASRSSFCLSSRQ